MRRKSLGTCVLLLGLLLGTASRASADTISLTTVSVTNFQIVPTSGTVVLLPSQIGSATAASGAAVNSFDEEGGDSSESQTFAQAFTSITFASAGGVSDFATRSLSTSTNVTLPGCGCEAETEGHGVLRLSFMITGGTGPVDVTFSALTQTIQNLVTDEFSTFAVSETRIFLNVIDVATFSFDSRFRIGPNESTVIETQRLISEVVTLQFNQQYSVVISGLAVSRAGSNEIPEPATVVLLVSGLGFMTGFVRKRRLKQ
jgi:hypothetical protein